MAKKKTDGNKKDSKPKKANSKKTNNKKSKVAKDINVVVPVPAPIPINIPVTIPTNLGILDRMKKIKDKVFSTFGLNSPND